MPSAASDLGYLLEVAKLEVAFDAAHVVAVDSLGYQLFPNKRREIQPNYYPSP